MRMGFGFVENGPVIDIEKLFPIPTTVMDASVSQDFWQVLPKVSLKYECSSNTFTYVSVAKGYKTGGLQRTNVADVMQSQMQYDMMSAFKDMMPIEVKELPPSRKVASYKPEKSWNYEVGAHLSTPSHKVQADLALFYIDCRDQQLTVFPEGQVTGRLMTNAGRTRSFGGEASLLATLWRNLDLQVSTATPAPRSSNSIRAKPTTRATSSPNAPAAHALRRSVLYAPHGLELARIRHLPSGCQRCGPNLLERSEHLLATLLRPAGSLDSLRTPPLGRRCLGTQPDRHPLRYILFHVDRQLVPAAGPATHFRRFIEHHPIKFHTMKNSSRFSSPSPCSPRLL